MTTLTMHLSLASEAFDEPSSVLGIREFLREPTTRSQFVSDLGGPPTRCPFVEVDLPRRTVTNGCA
jgi:hypothetical protein